MGLISKAVRINNANQIADGVITGAKLVNDTITADKIAILDYVRSLRYDVYDDIKTDVKAVIDHDQATNTVRLRTGSNIATQNDVFVIASSSTPAALKIGGSVSVLNMGTKRIIGLGAPVAVNDALRFGQPEIRDAEISASANISRNKLAVGAPQRVNGTILVSNAGYYDITGLITPSSYPALAIGFAGLDNFTYMGASKLVIRNQASVDVESTVYANIDDSGTVEGVARGVTNMVSAIINSGSVKLSHLQDTLRPVQTVYGVLMVIEL